MSKTNKGAPELFAVIMAGGKGKRFWPKSREKKPKQLLPIGAKEPLVRETVTRLMPLLAPERVFISCGKDLAPKIAAVVPEVPRSNFIIEPTGRDTAPCVGLAIEQVRRLSPGAGDDSVIAVLPADHRIGKPGRFRKTLQRAARTAFRKKLIMTIGIVPDRPSQAYGYIQPGQPVPGERGVAKAKQFVEKPDQATAKRYLKRGFLWNAGMFVFRIDVMREAYKKHQPGMAKRLAEIGAAMGTRKNKRVTETIFPKLEKISIDYAIMEKTDRAAVIPGDFDWTDVGGWDALYCMMGGDGESNVKMGNVEIVDSRGCYAEGTRLVALVGVEDLVVIETEDAVLVLNRERDGDIKKLTDLLAKKGIKEVL